MDETDLEFPADGKKSGNARAVRSAEKPRYYLLQPQYINDTYYSADQIIEGSVVPNEGMEPRNQAAEDAMDAWLESLPARPQRHEDFFMQAMMNRPRHEVPAPTPAAKKKPGRISGKETAPNEGISVVPDDSPRRGGKKQMGTIVNEVPSPGSI